MRNIEWGKGLDVEFFSIEERRRYQLSSPKTIIEVCNDDTLMDEALEYCLQKKVIGFDLETSGLNFFKDRIVLAQVGDLERQYLIWLDKCNPRRLLEILRSPEIVKIGLHLKFDLDFMLYQYGFEARAKNVIDTFNTGQIIICGVYDNVGLTKKMTSMETQARQWLGLRIPKADNLRIGWDGWDPVSFRERINDIKRLNDMAAVEALERQRQNKLLYAADDVVIPILLAHEHKPWLKSLGLVPTVKLESEFLPVLSDIEVRGMPFNTEAWLDLAVEAEETVKQARKKLDDIFDVRVTVSIDEEGKASYERDKNYGSPFELADLIREWMWTNCGVEVIANNKHFKQALEKYGSLNQAVIDRIFVPSMEPDPDDPTKKKKVGYPNMSDTLERMWELYRGHLPAESFILPNTDSKTLRFFRIIYEAPFDKVQEDVSILPTTFGFPSELVDPILTLRGTSKQVSTYGRSWMDLVSEDGRLHTSYNQTELSTGRVSNTPSTLNLPTDSRYRECFRARPGYKVVGADYSQIEPRVIAQLSRDPTYMRVFWSERPGTEGFERWCDESVTEPLDLYTEVGKEIGQIPAHFTKRDTKGEFAQPEGLEGRQQSKTANLGLGYGTGKGKFHYMLCLDTNTYHTRRETDSLYDVYWSSMGKSKEYLDYASYLADPEKSSRKVRHPYSRDEITYAESVLGRKRFFLKNNPTWWTTGRNQPIQSTAGGEMLKLAATRLTHWAWEHEIDGGIINLIHDEILAEVREDQAEDFAKAMQKIMEEVGQELCPDVPIVAEASIDDYWKKD